MSFHPQTAAENVAKFITALIFIALSALVTGLITMLLWNLLMPEIFGLKEISFWQGWGLCVLGSMLFPKSSSSK